MNSIEMIKNSKTKYLNDMKLPQDFESVYT